MIRKMKFYNSGNTIQEVIENNSKRYEDITREFKSRRKQLLEHKSKFVDHIEKLLLESNVYYIREKTFFSMNSDLFYADFYIPLFGTTIEIDGLYHETPSRKFLDKIKEQFLEKRNIATIRIKNEECLKIQCMNKKEILRRAKKYWQNKEGESKIEWQYKVLNNKEWQKDKLLHQFSDKLKDVDLKARVGLYEEGVKKFEFDNIFELHFSTEIKFKDVLKKLNRYSSRQKYNIKYLPVIF